MTQKEEEIYLNIGSLSHGIGVAWPDIVDSKNDEMGWIRNDNIKIIPSKCHNDLTKPSKYRIFWFYWCQNGQEHVIGEDFVCNWAFVIQFLKIVMNLSIFWSSKCSLKMEIARKLWFEDSLGVYWGSHIASFGFEANFADYNFCSSVEVLLCGFHTNLNIPLQKTYAWREKKGIFHIFEWFCEFTESKSWENMP